MVNNKVTLSQMLACRERRFYLQQKYIQLYQCPVISFSMNIPGSIKSTKKIRAAFTSGKTLLLNRLELEKIPIIQIQESHEITGDELVMAVDYPAEMLKGIALQIEQAYTWGRLLDIDVIDKTGVKLSRSIYRKCLICDKQAQECARTQRHSIKELQKAIDILLKDF